jgi:hypothetical protein
MVITIALCFGYVQKMILIDSYKVQLSDNTYTVAYVGKSPENQARIVDIYIKFFSSAVVSISAIIAVFTYMRNGRLERAKWLSELHEKFFVDEKYGKMRKLLDYKNPEADYAKLSESFPNREENNNVDNEELLVNYLNFFEFIAVLEKRNQLSIGEINDTFGYYISQLRAHKWIVDSLHLYQFKNLPNLVNKITEENRL